MKKLISLFTFGLVALPAVCAPATVGNVRFTQDKTTRAATVLYDLAGDAAVITFDVLTNGVSIGAANVTAASGHVNCKVEAGTDRVFVWNALESWPMRKIRTETVTVKVKAWSLDDPPPVMALDLRSSNGAVSYYEDLSQLPGGITDRRYKTDFLVFRKIPAKGETFATGYTNGVASGYYRPRKMAFTDDFYLGVYEVTQRQLERMTSLRSDAAGSWRGSSHFAEAENADVLPAESISYGHSDAVPYKYQSLMAWNNWDPASSVQGTRSVYSQSILGGCRAYTGLALDIPTAAQWEFACKAGTSSPRYNGKGEEDAGEIAWHSGNSDGKVREVGTKEPNAWGLYDMLGNVAEWVLDRTWTSFSQLPDYAVDYPGPDDSGVNRTVRGGSVQSDPSECVCWKQEPRYQYNKVQESTTVPYYIGFRLWAPATAAR